MTEPTICHLEDLDKIHSDLKLDCAFSYFLNAKSPNWRGKNLDSHSHVNYLYVEVRVYIETRVWLGNLTVPGKAQSRVSCIGIWERRAQLVH